MNSWDEVNLSSVQGVCVMRVSLHQHHLSAELQNQQSLAKFGCISEYTTSEYLENSRGSTQFFYSDDFFTN